MLHTGHGFGSISKLATWAMVVWCHDYPHEHCLYCIRVFDLMRNTARESETVTLPQLKQLTINRKAYPSSKYKPSLLALISAQISSRRSSRCDTKFPNLH